jgi:hypothetical protein
LVSLQLHKTASSKNNAVWEIIANFQRTLIVIIEKSSLAIKNILSLLLIFVKCQAFANREVLHRWRHKIGGDILAPI